MARVRVKAPSKSFWKRAGWASLAGLFIFTALGIGILSFWQNTHNDNTAANQTPQTVCQPDAAVTAETLPVPEVYKTSTKVDSVQSTDLKVGTGNAITSTKDCIVAKYYGTLATDGTVFDENYTKPTALKISLDSLIPGWQTGMIGMKEGGERRMVIPAALGYGAQGNSGIPPNADIVFVVKLEQIVK